MRAFILDPVKLYFIERSRREQKEDTYRDVVAQAKVKGVISKDHMMN